MPTITSKTKADFDRSEMERKGQIKSEEKKVKVAPLKSLKLSKAERKESAPTAISSIRDEYPYGLCLDLGDTVLEKLGIKELPEVGDEYHIHAIGKVTGVGTNANERNESRSMGVQLIMASFAHEDEEKTERETTEHEEKEER